MKKKKDNLINGRRPEFGNPEHIKWLEEQRNPPIDLTTDEGIMQLVREFSEVILEFSNGQVEGMCFAVCAPLSGYMEFMGIKNEVKECDILVGDTLYQHIYIELSDGRVIDPTASQFINPDTGKKMAKFYLGAKPKWYIDVDIKESSDNRIKILEETQK